MFRNSAQLSSNSFFRIYQNRAIYYPPTRPIQASFFAINGVQNGDLFSTMHPFSKGISSSSNPLKPELARACRFSSSSAVPITVASASKAKEITEAVLHYGRCYWELSKARLSMLVVATSGAGFVLGSGSTVDFTGLCWTCAGTMMVSASANSLNQVFERTNDAKMKRTMRRPLPSGRLTVPHAVIWASSIGVAGTALLAWKANFLAAAFAASNLALYSFVYTPLKQLHPVNTWVGAVVGAVPPLLGWVAASGQVASSGMILPAALYFWQLPHFMALAYLCRNDYASGGFRMLSLTDASGERTALVALRNCLYLLPVGFLAYNWGLTSGWFCFESAFVTSCMTATALLFYLDRSSKNARRMFHASLLYLPVFMAGLLLHRLPNNPQEFALADPGTQVRLPFWDTEMEENVNVKKQEKQNKNSVAAHARPPVAYASIAPFPFLPPPPYVSAE